MSHILTHREAEIAAHVIKGKANKKIADDLFVCEKTIKFHLTNIYRKLSVKSRAEMIAGWFNKSLDLNVAQLIFHFEDLINGSKKEEPKEEQKPYIPEGETVLPLGA